MVVHNEYNYMYSMLIKVATYAAIYLLGIISQIRMFKFVKELKLHFNIKLLFVNRQIG